MKARFGGGKCSVCGNRIEKDQDITWPRRGVKGQIRHVLCNSPVLDGPVQKTDETIIETPETETEQPENMKPNKPDNPSNDELGRKLAAAVQPYLNIPTPKQELDKHAVQKLIDAALAGIQLPLTIEVKNTDTQEVKTISGAHSQMPKLLYLLSKRHHAYLYGPPGSGKSTAAKQAADGLGVEYGYISLNPQTPDSRLMGFIDANGTYRETVFYRLYRDGGVFCIDEVDNAAPSLLTTLNSCLENGHAAFPCGMVAKHKDFVLVATGNTNGRGANPMFPERRPFDAAFGERFTFLFWDYDTGLEKAVTLAINPDAGDWFNWIQAARKHCITAFPRVLISPRASFKGADYLKDSNWKPAEIAETLIFKGLEAYTVAAILRAVPLP